MATHITLAAPPTPSLRTAEPVTQTIQPEAANASGSAIVLDRQVIEWSRLSGSRDFRDPVISSPLHNNLQAQAQGVRGLAPAQTETERFQTTVQRAGKPDCLKPPEGSAGSPLGLLALPFLVWDAASGKCV